MAVAHSRGGSDDPCRSRRCCRRTRIIKSDEFFRDIRGRVEGQDRVCTSKGCNVENDGVAFLLGKILNRPADVSRDRAENFAAAFFDSRIILFLFEFEFTL